MARVVIALPPPLGDEFSAEALRHAHSIVARAGDTDSVHDAVQHSGATAALVSASPTLLTTGILDAADAAGVRLIALAATSAERLHAARLGIREIAELREGWAGVERLLADAHPAARAGRSSVTGRGTIIAVWGPSGAPGRTTVAIALAAEFAILGHRVLLVDADTHAAAIAPALGLLDEAPGFAAACRLAGSASLTEAELDRVSQRYESPSARFEVLTGLGRPAHWTELTADRVRGALEGCRARADVIVVDIASSLENHDDGDARLPPRTIATRTVLSVADRVISVGAADPVGLSRFLRGHPRLLELAEGEVRVVMNKLRSTAIGLGPREQVTRALATFADIRDAVLVPDDRAACDAAVLSGRTLADVAPRSPARTALCALAATLVPASPSPTRRRTGLVSRGTR